jgi:DUF1365 family protein
VESCIYEGLVRHRRWQPIEHAFEFRLFMMYLDLEELPRVFRGRWLWSHSRPSLARFRRSDHLGDPNVPLERAVRDIVEKRCGRRPCGPIRLLTHLRYLGYVMNPVSFYYCFGPDGRGLDAVVAEVNNTPWNERHVYVLTADGQRSPKEFHVSPFMDMEMDYRWTLREPGAGLVLGIENQRPEGGRLFDATLSLHRVEIDGRSLGRVLARYPLMTAQVFGGIYWQAWRLRRKGAPFFPHPGRSRGTPLEIAS